MEELFLSLLTEYGYIILFAWSILEGEIGLVMGGIMCHTGDMSLLPAILTASAGGFVGDQIYFHLGRFNQGYIHKKLRSQRRKFAISHLLLKKYGWPIIFVQRYLYGLRTIIPMSIGLTKYSAKKFALINLCSALIWAAATITPAYFYGAEILSLLQRAKSYWYISLPLLVILITGVYLYLGRVEENILSRRLARRRSSTKCK